MHLPPLLIDEVIKRAFMEDIGYGDITTEAIVPPQQMGRGEFIAREELILSGLQVACRVFYLLHPLIKCSSEHKDGDRVKQETIIASIEGPAWVLLLGERLALNFLQHMSGISTLTHKYVKLLEGYRVKILPTRKTIPGMRLLEKYSVCVAGGGRHRFGLHDGVLIKENHIKLAGGVKNAISRIKKNLYHGMKIEVEVRDLKELQEALEAGVDAVLLDNMEPQKVTEAVRINQRRALLEVSGGIKLENVREYAAGVDYISIGTLTHSAPAVDITFLVK